MNMNREQLAIWRLKQITDFCESVTDRTVWDAYYLAHAVLELASATPPERGPSQTRDGDCTCGACEAIRFDRAKREQDTDGSPYAT